MNRYNLRTTYHRAISKTQGWVVSSCLWLPALLIFWCSCAGLAQAAFLEKAGVRPVGMGGAFVARADDSSAGLWNPAGLAQLKETELYFAYSSLYPGLSDESLGKMYLGYVVPVYSSGALGLNVLRLTAPLYSENTVSLAYSQKLQNLYIGASAKGLFADFRENEYTQIDPLFQAYGYLTKDVAFDVGILIKLDDVFMLGASAQNVNQPNVALDEATENRLPREFRGGLSVRLGNFQPALDLTWRDTYIRDKRDINLHLGLEARPVQDLMMRAGMNFYELTAGASYRFYSDGGTLQLDYAFSYPMPFEIENDTVAAFTQSPLTETSGSHQFALSVRFSDVLELLGTQKPAVSTQDDEREAQRFRDDPQRGIIFYQQALKQDQADARSHYYLGQLHRQIGQLDEAILHLGRAATLEAQSPRYHYALARTYEEKGNSTGESGWYNKAIIEYEKTRMLDPDYQDTVQRREALSGIKKEAR